jgi:hypothetical protein
MCDKPQLSWNLLCRYPEADSLAEMESDLGFELTRSAVDIRKYRTVCLSLLFSYLQSHLLLSLIMYVLQPTSVQADSY